MNLSKSKYIDAMYNCPKKLWLKKYFPDEEILEDNEKQIEEGHAVGELAKKYFEGSVEVMFNHDNLSQMEIDTRKFIEDKKEYICEATFIYDNLFCSVDILHLINEKEVEIYEVKAVNKIQSKHMDDVSFQYYVLSKLGYKVKKGYLMHLNRDYIRQGDLDLKGLFVIDDYTEYAKEQMSVVEQNIKYITDIADVENEPETKFNANCQYCTYFQFCKKKYQVPNAFDLGHRFYFMEKINLINNGIITFEDIYKADIVNEKHMIQIRETLYGKEDYVEKEKVKKFLDTLTFPIYHLDFETFQEAIPPFDGIWPYRQVPFQYSLHIQNEKGIDAIHKEFLGKGGTDPRREIAMSLCENIPTDVCVLAYHKSFECGRLRELANDFPDLSEHLLKIESNVKDLEDVFRNLYYYNKDMGGSASIKKVLPALFPDDQELDYHKLDQIHHGGEAMVAFFDMAKMNEKDEERTRKNLLKYCELDTYAMVKILDKLYKSIV